MSTKIKAWNWLTFILIFTGIVVALLGMGTIVTWYSHGLLSGMWDPILLKMQDGASLGFIIAGLAFVALALERWRISQFFAVLLLIISMIAMMRYFISLPAEISDIVSMITMGSKGVETIPPHVALSFLLIGLGIFKTPEILQSNNNSLSLGIIGVVILVLGAITLFSLDMQDERVNNLQFLSYSAVTTGISIMLLGVGMVTCAGHQTRFGENVGNKIFPLIIIVIVVMVTLLLWQALLSQKTDNIHRMTSLQANGVRNEIAARLQAQIFSLERMARRWEFRQGIPQAEWEADATTHVSHNRGYLALEWIDPDMRVRWVVPANSNQVNKDLNALFEQRRGDAILLANKNKKASFTRSVNLLEGGRGFLIYIPIFIDHHFDGFLVAAIRYQELFDSILQSGIAPGYNLAVYDDDEKIYQRGSSADQLLQQYWSQNAYVSFSGTSWRIQAWPTAELLELERSVLPTVTLVMGMIVSLLLGLAIRFAQLAQSRAVEIEVANRDLKREINMREQVEAAKREIEKILLQSQKLQAIGTLAGGIAHDFNNMLYSIMGYVELAKSDAPVNSVLSSNLQKVLEVSQRGKDLVAQILSFSRQQQYHFEPLSLHELIESSLTLTRPIFPADISLKTYFHTDKDMVYGNNTQLQQVFMNVIKNAIDAMPKGGQLTIRIARQVFDSHFRQKIHINNVRPVYWVVEFQDVGQGMEKATQERLFEPFFTTKEVNKGTGLGMAIAHGIIQDHQGEIIVKSEVGVGTSIFVYLPEYDESMQHDMKPKEILD